MNFVKKKSLGIVLCAVIALVSTFLAKIKIANFSFEIIGAPVFAILIGMIITLCAPSFAKHDYLKEGIQFTSKKILQWAVIILGFSLNLSTIAAVGVKSLPVILSTIAISLIVSFIMMKLLKVDSNIACLIGVGSSICGGSAIAATAPVIEANDKEVAQSISVIFLFNVLAALIFPTLGRAIGLGTEGFAVFAGTAVNDTSSVTAAASTAESIYGVEGILSTAVTVKLTRTLAIIPITLVLALYRTMKMKKMQSVSNSSEEADATVQDKKSSFSFKKVFPFFILFFIAASLITTLVGLLPDGGFTAFYNGAFIKAMKWLAKFFIAMAMCAIGLNTNIVELIKKGGKPILIGFVCWVCITLVSIGMQLVTGIFYTNL